MVTISHQSHQRYQTVDCRSTSAKGAYGGIFRSLVNDIGAEAIQFHRCIHGLLLVDGSREQELQLIVAHGGRHRAVLLEPVFRRCHQLRRIGAVVPVSEGR